MTAIAPILIADLTHRGIILSRNGDKLRVEAPAKLLTDDLRAVLTDHKTELLAVLAGDWAAAALALLAQVQEPDARAELAYLFAERVGICELDGNLPKADAERIAYEQIAQALADYTCIA